MFPSHDLISYEDYKFRLESLLRTSKGNAANKGLEHTLTLEELEGIFPYSENDDFSLENQLYSFPYPFFLKPYRYGTDNFYDYHYNKSGKFLPFQYY